MAESKTKKPAKKRQLKKTETVRQRVERSGSDAPKTRHVRKSAGIISKPFKVVGGIIAFILRPFSFLLIPFKTKPARLVGKVLASIFLFRFFRDAWKELRQVQWPTARETVRLTTAVFIFSLVFGTIVAITDYGLDKVFKKVFID